MKRVKNSIKLTNMKSSNNISVGEIVGNTQIPLAEVFTGIAFVESNLVVPVKIYTFRNLPCRNHKPQSYVSKNIL